MQAPMRVFIDLDIGNRDEHDALISRYQSSLLFYAHAGPQFGLVGALDSLDDEAKNLLTEAYSSDPTWSSKGEFLAQEPAPLRAGRLVIELYDKEVPKTVENFKCLLTGERGKGKSSGKALHFKGCKFHRVVSNFMAQTGDIIKGDGSGGDSIYGGKFNDEKAGLKLKHDKLGTVAMANSGKNSNTSQFYITLTEQLPQLNGKHVVFGHVTEGLDLLQRIDGEVASKDGSPQQPLIISDCGVL